MIAIVNISPDPKPFGIHRYSVRINKTEVCQFDHKREDGLAACLLAAAKAVEADKWKKIAHMLNDSSEVT